MGGTWAEPGRNRVMTAGVEGKGLAATAGGQRKVEARLCRPQWADVYGFGPSDSSREDAYEPDV